MSMPNIKPTDKATLVATLDPVSQGAGTVTSGWVPLSTFENILALIAVGAFGASATVDASLQQAQDASGTGSKAITGKAITQLVAAGGNNRQVQINCRSEELDVDGGFTHVRLSVTVGTAATLIFGAIFGFDARYQPAAQKASVAQVVS